MEERDEGKKILNPLGVMIVLVWLGVRHVGGGCFRSTVGGIQVPELQGSPEGERNPQAIGGQSEGRKGKKNKR